MGCIILGGMSSPLPNDSSMNISRDSPQDDVTGNNSVCSSGTSTPNRMSKLDSCPREQLVTFIKKQTLTVKQLKDKYKVLELESNQKKQNHLKQISDALIEKDVLLTLISTNKSEADEQMNFLKVKYEDVNTSLSNQLKISKDFKENMECLQTQNTTLMSSYHNLQVEYEESKDQLSPETQISDAEELNRARLQLEEWERMMSMLQAERDATRDDLNKAELREANSNDEFAEVTEALNQALSERDNANEKCLNKENESKRYEEMSDTLQTTIIEMKLEAGKHEKIIKDYEQEKLKDNQIKDDVILKLEKEIDLSKELIKELQCAEEKYRIYEENEERSKLVNNDKEVENKLFEMKVSEMQVTIDGYEEMLASRQANYSSHLLDTKDDNNRLMLNMATLRDELDTSLEHGLSLESLQSKHEHIIDELANKLKEQTIENQKFDFSEKELKSKFDVQLLEISKLNDEIEQLRISLDNLEDQSQCVLTDNMSENQLHTVEERNEELEGQLLTLRNERIEDDHRREILTAENMTLKQDIQKGDDELGDIMNRVLCLTEENDLYRSESQSTVDDIASQMKTCELELIQVRDAFNDASETINLLKLESNEITKQRNDAFVVVQEKQKIIDHYNQEQSEDEQTADKVSSDEFNLISKKLESSFKEMVALKIEHQTYVQLKEKENEEYVLKVSQLEEKIKNQQISFKLNKEETNDSMNISQEQYHQLENAKDELEVDITILRKEYRDHKEGSVNEIEALNIKLESQIHILNNRIKEIEQDLTEKEQSSILEINKINEQMNCKKLEYEEETLKLVTEHDTFVQLLKQDNNDLENKIAVEVKFRVDSDNIETKRKDELTMTENDLTEARNCKKEIENDLNDLKVKYTRLETEYSMNKENFENISEKLDDSNKKLVEEINLLKKDSDEIYNNSKKEFEDKKICLENENKDLVSKQEDINNNLNSQIDKLKVEMKSMNDSYKIEIFENLDISNKNINKLESEIVKITTEYNNYKINKENNDGCNVNEKNTLNKELLILQKNLKDLQEEKISMKTIVNNENEERTELTDEIVKLTREIVEIRQETENQTIEANTVIEKLTEKYNNCQQESEDQIMKISEEFFYTRNKYESDFNNLNKDFNEFRLSTENEKKISKERLEEYEKSITSLKKDNIEVLMLSDSESIKYRDSIKQLENIIKEKDDKNSIEIENFIEKIEKLNEKENKLVEKLEKLENESQRGNVYELEIADFERTVRTLNDNIQEKKKIINNHETEIDEIKDMLSNSMQDNGKLTKKLKEIDIKCKKLKILIVKSKKELSESRTLEMMANDKRDQFETQLQSEATSIEEWKIKLSELASENTKIMNSFEICRIDKERNESVLKENLETLHQTLSNEIQAKDIVTNDYELYKIRVHGVLKQQKTKAQTDEELNEQINKVYSLEENVNQLRTDATVVLERLSIQGNELAAISTDRDRLKCQLDNANMNISRKVEDYCEKIQCMELENNNKQTQHENTIRKLSMEHSLFKQNSKEEKNKNINKIKELDSEIYELRLKIRNVVCEKESEIDEEIVQVPIVKNIITLFPPTIERGERPALEGQEVNDNGYQIKMSEENKSISFERLLSSESDKIPPSSVIIESSENFQSIIAEQKQQIMKSQKDTNNLTELLNESEATVMRLSDQAKLLKEEVRRYERNEKRETSVSNMEYLKNIVIKFITLSNEEEKLHLIPVMKTMLCLNDNEIDKLKLSASLITSPGTNKIQEDKNWSGYLHRWSGL